MKIRFCEHTKGASQLAHRLQTQFPDLNIKIKKCVKECKVCKHQSFALVDKQPIVGTSCEDLYTALLHLITAKTTC